MLTFVFFTSFELICCLCLMPLGSLKDDEESSCSMLSDKTWSCPWGRTIIDKIAPLFRKILEENFLSSSGYALEDTKTNRLLWWNQRRKLDQWLSDLLR